MNWDYLLKWDLNGMRRMFVNQFWIWGLSSISTFLQKLILLYPTEKQFYNSNNTKSVTERSTVNLNHCVIVMKSSNSVCSDGGGNVFFFCVAGQNRSATLAIAVQILHGKALEEVLTVCVRETQIRNEMPSWIILKNLNATPPLWGGD